MPFYLEPVWNTEIQLGSGLDEMWYQKYDTMKHVNGLTNASIYLCYSMVS